MLKHQLCWCDFLFDFFWCFSGRRKREKKWLSYLCKKGFHMWGRNAAAVSCHTTYWVLYIKWPITSVRGKIKVILSSTPLTFCFSLFIGCDWWSSEICELPSRAHLAHDGPEAAAVTSRADLLLLAAVSVGLRSANEDIIRSVSSAWHKPSRQHTYSTFSHLLSRWTTNSFTQYSHRRWEVILCIISSKWITSRMMNEANMICDLLLNFVWSEYSMRAII